MLQATLLFLTVLAAGPFPLEEKTRNAPPGKRAVELGAPALFSWGDFDGDARLDLAAVSGDGTLQLLTNAGDGRFEDATERVGLSGVANAALALWADYDGDGRLDLFVGARAGASRLFHNEGGVFIDMSAASGLTSEGAVQSAQWLDRDGDGRLDLFVVTAEKDELFARLFRGLEGGFFELAELSLAGEGSPAGLGGLLVDESDAGTNGGDTARGGTGGLETQSPPGTRGEKGGQRVGGSIPGRARSAVGHASGGPALSAPSCADAILDEANPQARCLTASTTPMLGRLYPLSANLFVALGGSVGIGTTSPQARLDVAGTARMTGTLTLEPSDDRALDVDTGSIYKGGELFLHTRGSGNTGLGLQTLASTTTGTGNTAVGNHALSSSTSGFFNTAMGDRALTSNTGGFSNTAFGNQALLNTTIGTCNTASGNKALYTNRSGSGNTAIGCYALRYNVNGVNNTSIGILTLINNRNGGGNTAIGSAALRFNTSGGINTASGDRALYLNTTGGFNTASGYAALRSNTTGMRNAASGSRALFSNTTGSRNIAVGAYAGNDLTTGSDNIAIGNRGAAGEGGTIRIGTAGTHARAFLAGIRGVTTGVADAVPVVVDSAGQLGTISSSRRFKKDIADMGDATDRLLELRPVVFRHKNEQTVPNGEVPLEYGLIAEEVAEILPDLVVYDEAGLPLTVKYHVLSTMLLNELKALDERFEAQSAKLHGLEGRLGALESRASPATVPTASLAGSR